MVLALRFVWLSGETVSFALYISNRLVFITELESVYCAVRAESLYKTDTFPPYRVNPLNPELNPICYLLALLGAHHFLHVNRIRVKLLTFRRLMSYTYMEHPFLMFLDHTQRRTTVGRTPLGE